MDAIRAARCSTEKSRVLPLSPAGLIVDDAAGHVAARAHGEVGETRHVLEPHDLELRLEIVVRARQCAVVGSGVPRPEEGLEVGEGREGAVPVGGVGVLLDQGVLARREGECCRTAQCKTKESHRFLSVESRDGPVAEQNLRSATGRSGLRSSYAPRS
jgi:hypothetical protein